MAKIERLTTEQEASIPEFRAKWIALGESTARSTPEEMRDAVNGLYDSIGQKHVPIFVMNSPLGCILAANIFTSKLRDNIRDNIGANIGANIRDNIGANIGANIRDNIRDNIGANIRDNIGANIRDNIWARKATYEYVMEWGNHNIGWIAFAAFFETIGHKYPANLKTKFDALRHYHETCGWIYCFEGMAFVSQRPSIVRRDDHNRLHCEVGHAIEYADGYGFCAWNGVRVPDHWIKDRSNLDANEVISAMNTEQRAVGGQIIGWPKMLKVLKAKIIDDSGNDDIGQLIELTLPGLPEPGLFLKAVCPRNGIIVEGVPRVSDVDGKPIKTAIAAQAWRIGDPASEFTQPPTRT